MQSLILDLSKLNEFYYGMKSELSTVLQTSGTKREQSLTDSILENRTRLVQIERMNAHITQLSEDLKRFRNEADPDTRQEVEALVSEAKSNAIQVHELCTQASEKIETNKNVLKKELEDIGKGKQFLKSSKPVKNNYPKFIDSTG